MDLPQVKSSKEENLIQFTDGLQEENKGEIPSQITVSLEAEIPEELYKGMKEFICLNPQWDQYSLMSSALANFLFQNGSENRAVTEKYLNDLFTLTDS